MFSYTLPASVETCPLVLRGPGGRGPWPNPNTNSVSRVSSHLRSSLPELGSHICCFSRAQIAYSSSSPGNYVVSLPPMDVVFPGSGASKPAAPPSRCTQRSFVFLSVSPFPPQGPPGGGGPPGTPIMPSPGGELRASRSPLISAFIQLWLFLRRLRSVAAS